MTVAIETIGLVKHFGRTRAVSGIDLRIGRGSVYGLLGPNGAGKTTTIRILATLLEPDGGTASVLGHDVVREAAAGRRIDPDLLLRLEHIIVSHQRLPEWGSPKPPMTPEALLIHYADDVDAKFQTMYAALRDDAHPGPFTSNNNPLRQKVYRGPQ